MAVFCKELNQEFETKKEMFLALKKDAEKIIGLKKVAIKNSDPVCLQVRNTTTKAEGNEQVGIGSKVYAVINTTNWFDSHGDVHIDGIWDVSVKDQRNKLYYIINHELEIGKVIAFPKDNEAYVQSLKWSDLGLDYPGNTQALMFAPTLTEATNKDALYAIAQRAPIQNSVRMQYIGMTLCIDDSDDDFKQEKANFDKYIKVVANADDAREAGFFWAITEAKIYKEGSAVLFGSNEATPVLYADPGSTSQPKIEAIAPQESRQVVKSNYYFTI
jgi:hypothetical protein